MRFLVLIWCLCAVLSASAQETPRTRPGSELQDLNEAVRRMTMIIDGRPHPQDLADCIWSSMDAKDRKLVPGTVIATSVGSYDESYDHLYFVVLSILSNNKGKTTPICRTTTWEFTSVGNGKYRVLYWGTARQMDRVAVELNFWCDEAASFPPLGKVKTVRTLFDKLLAVDQHPEYISVRPTMDTLVDGKTGKVLRSTPVRPDNRDPAVICDLIRSWKQSPETAPRYIGITTSPYQDAILWVDDGSALWAFLWRNEQGHWLLSDWYRSEQDLLGVSVGKVRLCTLPVRVPSEVSVGGAGSVIQLPDLQSETGQLLTKLFRFAKLNNQKECFNYFAASVTKDQRLAWWKHDQPVIESLDLDLVTITQQSDGTVLVSYPIGDKVRQLFCNVLSNRVSITRISSRMASSSNYRVNAVRTPIAPMSRYIGNEAKGRTLVDRAIGAAKLGNAEHYFSDAGPSHGKLLVWVAELSSGKVGLTGESLYVPLVDDRALLILIEQRGTKCREVVFFINHDLSTLYGFDYSPFMEKSELMKLFHRQQSEAKQR